MLKFKEIQELKPNNELLEFIKITLIQLKMVK